MSVPPWEAKRWVMENGAWRHRAPWKMAINRILFAMQPCLGRKLAIVSVCIPRHGGGPPIKVDYQFRRVRQLEHDTVWSD